YQTPNYGTRTIDASQLVWDFYQNLSNYRALFRNTIDDAGGKAWIAEFAQPLSTLWFSEDEVQQANAIIPYPFVTRLRTEMLIDHLAEDLQLAPSLDIAWISNYVQAGQSINDPPPPTCPDYDGDGQPDTWEDRDHGGSGWVVGCRAGGAAGAGGAALVIAAVLLAAARRRRGS
ncbi:MAG TPA: hypothetical protein VL172_09215, partial [Kofleriaceae bacterium]|nr:hypothetical protein [Kofleriaceae bacterium]